MMINLTSNLEKSLESDQSILDGQGEQSAESFTELFADPALMLPGQLPEDTEQNLSTIDRLDVTTNASQLTSLHFTDRQPQLSAQVEQLVNSKTQILDAGKTIFNRQDVSPTNIGSSATNTYLNSDLAVARTNIETNLHLKGQSLTNMPEPLTQAYGHHSNPHQSIAGNGPTLATITTSPAPSNQAQQSNLSHLSNQSLNSTEQSNLATSQNLAPKSAAVNGHGPIVNNFGQMLSDPTGSMARQDLTVSPTIPEVLNNVASKPTQATPVSQWGPVTIATAAPQLQQAQQLLTPLREQLRFQIDQQIKTAELRLDPPSLGKVELNIRLDGDRLHIQMHAANAAVRDSLLMGLDRLRSELANDHGGQVNVDISHGESHSEQQQTEQHSIASSSLIDTASTTETTEQSTSNQVDLRA
ncbi:hypothetical protein FLM48_22335 [Shewanella sp. Scap07]|uniref:flagellar hook-length control protein FliK n=1 Tax=Shewanella sp. Scap07 TaxID=2589987 RepID=UPI0015BBA232|nr:flagellar hook-length control protein FliK [Shewanella sp. Scap07]QLE87572.1 hypothetical protein FLM48_22335 [Shewanella sp. Scap07]